MSNPFYNAMNNRGNAVNDPRQMLQKIRQDPVGVLRQAGYNLPENMNDPRQIIQHLMNSGQRSQAQLAQAQQIAQRMGFKL